MGDHDNEEVVACMRPVSDLASRCVLWLGAKFQLGCGNRDREPAYNLKSSACPVSVLSAKKACFTSKFFPLRWGVRNAPTCFLIPVPDGNAVVVVSNAGAPVCSQLQPP